MSEENPELRSGRNVFFISYNSSDREALDVLLSQVKLYIGLRNEELPDEEGRDLTPDNGRDIIFIDGVDELDVATHHTPWYGRQILNLILSEEELEALLGDLAEEYAEIETVCGRRIATAWYRKQVRDSLLQLLWKNICRRLQEWAGKWFRRPSS
jgi:hypothetical protein